MITANSKIDILEEIMIGFQDDYEIRNAENHFVKTYKERRERLIQIQKKLVKGKSVSEISEELEEEEDVIAQMIREMGEERAADKHLPPKLSH